MCLVAVAWRAHPRYPLILAGNRDEFHARPTTPAGWWQDHPAVLGGRDEVAGGSWLAVSRSGRLAVVINDPRRPPSPDRSASRGHLVRDFVAGERPSGRFLDALAVQENRYAGFCLVVGTVAQLRGFMTSPAGPPRRWTLKREVTVFSNSPPESPWPKIAWLKVQLESRLAAEEPDGAAILALLANRTPVTVPGADAAAHGVTPFIAAEQYGTRASTLLMMRDDGVCRYEERRFGPGGAALGATREEFRISP
jgi:uncharacterized protein with NRDE domain